MAAFRSLLELTGVWLASPASAPPAPVGWVDATPQVHVRAYAMEDSRVVREWSGWGELDIPFDMRGPVSTNVRAAPGSGHAHHQYLRPGGDAALVEIDARGTGIPDVWLGQATDFSVALPSTAVDVGLGGPETWLAEISLHDVPPGRSSAGAALAGAISTHTANHRLDLGAIEEGPAIETDQSGLSLWDLLGQIEDRSGLEVRLTAQAGRARLAVHLRDPLSTPDARRQVTLVEGENCAEVRFGGSLPTSTTEIVGVALAALKGTAAQSVGLGLPSGPIVGRRAALLASLYSQAASHAVGGPTILSSATPAADMLVRELATLARREIVPMIGGSAVITDERLWPYMRPGVIVSASFPSDPLGHWDQALAQLRTVTWTVTEGAGGAAALVAKCSVSFELWARSV